MMSKLVGRGDDRRSRALDEWDLLRREFRKRHTTVGGLDLGDWSGEMLRQEEAWVTMLRPEEAVGARRPGGGRADI